MAILTHGSELIIQYRADISFLKMLCEYWSQLSRIARFTLYESSLKTTPACRPQYVLFCFALPPAFSVLHLPLRDRVRTPSLRRKRVFTAAVTFNHGMEHANDPNSPKARQIQFVSMCGGCGFCAIDRQPTRGYIP